MLLSGIFSAKLRQSFLLQTEVLQSCHLSHRLHLEAELRCLSILDVLIGWPWLRWDALEQRTENSHKQRFAGRWHLIAVWYCVFEILSVLLAKDFLTCSWRLLNSSCMTLLRLIKLTSSICPADRAGAVVNKKLLKGSTADECCEKKLCSNWKCTLVTHFSLVYHCHFISYLSCWRWPCLPLPNCGTWHASVTCFR